jgi:hypothetical protein
LLPLKLVKGKQRLQKKSLDAAGKKDGNNGWNAMMRWPE